MELIQDKNNRTGLIGTIGFHAILLLIIIFCGMSYQDPPPPREEGITINFGTSNDGMGEEQPEEATSTSSEATTENTEITPPTEESTPEIVTQNTAEAVAVNSAESNTEETETVVEETASENLSEALNAFNNNSSATSNEGETNNSGDQGSLDGDPNSSNHTGGGIGNGVTFSLAGRNMLSTPKIKDNSQEQGKVVVDIVVDKNGKVIKATPGGRGSTTTSPLLYKKALEAALKTKFNAKPDLVGEQKGQMTFVFILN